MKTFQVTYILRTVNGSSIIQLTIDEKTSILAFRKLMKTESLSGGRFENVDIIETLPSEEILYKKKLSKMLKFAC